jgi:plastocyanin
MTRLPFLAVGLAVAALGSSGAGAAPAQATMLHARVGPSFTISLSTEAGARVTKLDPGTYVLQVDDMSEEHNFHLKGLGVDRATEIGDVGTQQWTVTISDGTYTYVCDPHQGEMRGSFTVGDAPAQQPPPSPTKPPSNAVTPKTKLALTSGPAYAITLKTAAGKAVRNMTTGTYTVTVRDRSKIHNAHLVGPGANRFTTVPYTGTRTWKVSLARAGTLQFLCDPHAKQGMRGAAKIVG